MEFSELETTLTEMCSLMQLPQGRYRILPQKLWLKNKLLSFRDNRFICGHTKCVSFLVN